MPLSLVLYTDPVIHQPCKEVLGITDDIQQLVAEMHVTMLQARGIGLAAPQVGLSLQIAVALLDNMTRSIVLINPKILSKSNNKSKLGEGCLSAPGIFVNKKRSDEIVVEYVDLYGKIHTETFKNMNARIVQHEIDHLNGKCIVEEFILK